ncbi:MAG: FAD-dependent oxidoreductase [Pseudomonadota bacterium]
MSNTASGTAQRPRIAIIGAGISGLVCAHHLDDAFDVTVFEANDYAGGHTNTVDVVDGGRRVAVDTGFIVYNERTYPRFCALLDSLGVATQASEMSFSVSCADTGLEWAGQSLNALFAQRRNLARPSFLRMIADILRFNRSATRLIHRHTDDNPSLGEFLARHRFSAAFRNDYLLPMCAAVWSAPPATMERFPVRQMLRFLDNHGLLQIRDRPQWRTITGGSRQYVKRLTAELRGALHLSTPVRRVARRDRHVELELAPGAEAGANLRFDGVVFACHSDQALALLDAPSAAERAVLSAIPYQENEAVLHTDTRLMPRSRRTWAAWNYYKPAQATQHVAVTYNMNVLQRLDASQTWCVTLNDRERIDPKRIAGAWTYHHPVFGPDSTEAQARIDEVSGTDRVWYCGAYWGYGFHEDGVRSAERCAYRLRVAYQTGTNEKLPLPRHARPSAA